MIAVVLDLCFGLVVSGFFSGGVVFVRNPKNFCFNHLSALFISTDLGLLLVPPLVRAEASSHMEKGSAKITGQSVLLHALSILAKRECETFPP